MYYLILLSLPLLLAFYRFFVGKTHHDVDISLYSSPHIYPHRDPFLGLDLLLRTANLMRLHKIIPAFADWHKVHGETFVVNSLGTPVIHTISPKNIEVIFEVGLQEWGVSPARLKAMQPLCGLGFINTDGEVWRHSRAMIQPAFPDLGLINLAPFVTAIEDILGRLPTDGSTIDLSQPLYELVRKAADYSTKE